MMNTHRERWSSAAATAGQPFAPDQVVLGHLLPSYQAAMDWQETVRHQRRLQSSTATSHQQVGEGVVASLRGLARRWHRPGELNPEPSLEALG